MLPVPVAVKVGVIPETLFKFVSLKVIETVEVETPSGGTGPTPLMSELVAIGVPATNSTVPSDLKNGVAILRVLISALVDLSVQVEIPLAFGTLQVVWVLPEPVVVKVGALPPETGLLYKSLIVIVMVEV